MRAGFINEYLFTPGSLVADASGNLSTYAFQAINGTIQKIRYDGGNYTATGSIQINVSGINVNSDQIWAIVSGTTLGNVGSATVVYPVISGAGPTGTAQGWVRPTINGVIRIIGSGLGASASGLGIAIEFI